MMRNACIAMTTVVVALLWLPAQAQRQMEVLGRGVVAVRTSSTQVYVGWRMLGTDPDDIGFNLYRSFNGGTAVKINGSAITATTDFVDSPPSLALPNTYHVRPVINGIEQAPSGSFTVPANMSIPVDHQYNIAPYLSVPLQVPPGGTTPDDVSYTYSPNDMSIGDLDGDGEFEYVLKWDPSNSKDNAHSGYTGNVFLDAYELDGTLLWRIDLGINIRAGAHYTQFMVYDLDGDGRAEIACKTAPGTVDGQGNPVLLPGDDPDADYRNASGYILSGPEYLTVFDGLTGTELATTPYIVPRHPTNPLNPTSSELNAVWGDGYGNRVDRFLACVAYLDGIRPSLVMCRGYYTRTTLTAWDWRNGQLTMRWLFDSADGTPGNSAYEGQGNHNLSVGDVDGDGKDEIIYGACSIDDDGTGLYSTGLHHGDALHVSDMDPARPGIEVWDVHEVASYAGAGEFRNAETGGFIWGLAGSGDTGRGLAAHIDAAHPGYQMWSSASGGVFDRFGNKISDNTPSINFAVWWDRDLQRELLDNAGGDGANTALDKWTGNGTTRILSPYSVNNYDGARNNNTSKSNPCLSGDVLGDWREEILCRNVDNDELMIFVSPHPATNRFRTFLHDSQYRQSLAWQNVAYNQPPHPGFYVGTGMPEPAPPLVSAADLVWVGDDAGNSWDVASSANWRTNGIWTNVTRTTFFQQERVLFDLSGSNQTAIHLSGSLQPAAVKVQSPTDYSFAGNGSLDGTMELTKAGRGALTLDTTNGYTGETVVWEGTLWVNGRLDASPVTVKKSLWLDSRVGGTGTLGQGVTVEAGGSISPGAGLNLPGTLNISNAFTQTGEATSCFDLSDDPSGQVKENDRVRVFGDLNVSGSNRIELHALDDELSEGVYTLVEYTGSFTGSLANFQVTGPVSAGTFLTNPPGIIALVVTTNTAPPGPRSLVWTGGTSGNTWDNGSSLNWHDGVGLSAFTNGDAVTFDDSGAPNLSVNLAGTLIPASVTADSSQDYTLAGSGVISGTNGLAKRGVGTLTIASAHAFSGGAVIEEGTVVLGSDAANQSGLGIGTITLRGGLLAMNSSSGTWTPAPWDLQVPAGGTGQLNADPRCDLTGSLTGSGVFTFHTPWVRPTVYGDWSGFTGEIRVITDGDGGDFRVANAAGFPGARLHVAANVLMYSRAPSGSEIPIGEFSADSGVTVSAGSGSSEGVQNAVTWRVGGLNTHSTNAASIVGTTSLIKEGTGRWVLTAASDYTGPTAVNEGTLVVNGALPNTTVNVTGGTLAGSGYLGGSVTIHAGGTLAPGNSVGTLTISNSVALEAGSLTVMEISKLPPGHDELVTTGTLTLGGTLVITNVGAGALGPGDAFALFSASTYAGGFAGIVLPPTGAGLGWDTSTLTSDGTIRVVTVAQPTITGVTASGGNLSVAGEGGVAGGTYYVLDSSDLTLPLSLWTPVQTNSFDGSGAFLFMIEVDSSLTHRFFTIQIP